MNSPILTKTINAEEKIKYILQDYKDEWFLESASIWVGTTSDKHMIQVVNHPDIYSMLEDRTTVQAIKGHDFFTVLTCGWAAALDESTSPDGEEIVPSENPKRRRIRLLIGADATGVASVLRFQDNPDEIITDTGQARGSLADAVWELLNDKLKAESEYN
jgi:hypothetical protein